MDKKIEIKKLLNVLRRMGRTARMNQWTGTREQADGHSIEQYNRILARLAVIDGEMQNLFAALPESATWNTLANASRDLCAYYEDEAGGRGFGDWGGWNGVWTDARSGIWIDKSAFRGTVPPEVSDLGEFIREKIAEWQDL